MCKRGGVKVGVAEVGVRVGVGTVTGIIPKYTECMYVLEVDVVG